MAVENADQKSTLASTGAASPSPLSPSTAVSKATSLQDQPVGAAASALPSDESGVVGSCTAPEAVVAPPIVQKKDGVLKAQAEKKKIDTRKKSLKRL
ncbi:hypothetical protein BVRB_4g097550 [Beta vulgaris subsp. vulgaris]|uniref:Uncharacterized protein n=1 Tax=Beta vulgaris subsp. vulgaris TaxID=3555 RepID=A0A0J8B9B1_BETVV|nr:hypothetical protein BVRB_4g097550 [Beta vulgaris subsp. vulgaris]